MSSEKREALRARFFMGAPRRQRRTVELQRSEVMRGLRCLIAADNMTQKETARVEAELAIARAKIRAGR
ncbi:hypothetical protein EOA31_06495 [Mesorhizobium sp. M4B.F.Ca.ET.049.02.1.2]|nr:hypothetical protein EOA31_06495 [Mesorhizobium sp. M4B.F.Ca.ET.049.02.1.2]